MNNRQGVPSLPEKQLEKQGAQPWTEGRGGKDGGLERTWLGEDSPRGREKGSGFLGVAP